MSNYEFKCRRCGGAGSTICGECSNEIECEMKEILFGDDWPDCPGCGNLAYHKASRGCACCRDGELQKK